MAQIATLESAVAEVMQNGLTVAFEGFTHLIPHAAAHEVIRQGYRDLTLIRMTPDLIYDQMIGMGRVKKLIFSYAGNPGVGLLRRMRDSVEKNWPHKIEVVEHSHAAMANAYEAGASNLPFAMLYGYLGAELPKVNDQIKEVVCPFTGQRLAAVPALRPDVTFIHAQKADRKGSVLIEGIVGIQKEAVLAAGTSVVSVEEIVDNLDTHPNAVILPHWAVGYVCIVEGGAHPSYAHGYYERDNVAYLEWDKIADDRDVFISWMENHVLKSSPADFAARVSHLRRKP